MPSGDFCYVAPRGGTPRMISVTELVQIAAPARSTGFGTFSGSLGSAKVFSRGAPRGSLWARQGPSFRPAFLGCIACPTATTTAAHSRHPRATSTLLAETAGPRLHRELLVVLREISPQEKVFMDFQHAIKPRKAVATARARGLRRRCRPAPPTPQSQPGLL